MGLLFLARKGTKYQKKKKWPTPKRAGYWINYNKV